MMLTKPTAMPAPDRSARDEHGRLVAVDWGPPPPAARGRGRWLIAVDGSAGALHAAAMVARLIGSEAPAEADLVHVNPWLVKEAAEQELPRRGWQACAAAREQLADAGIGWRLHVRMGDAAEQVTALARELGSRGIAIGSRGLTAAESLMLGSVAHRIVRLSAVPVLIVR